MEKLGLRQPTLVESRNAYIRSRSCYRRVFSTSHGPGIAASTVIEPSTMRIQNLLFSLFCLPLFSPTNASKADQIPIPIPTTETSSASADYVPQKHAKPSLADLLTIDSSASIFYTYARETELSSRLTDENSRLTVFVPTNKAVMALARKPCVLGPH